MTGRVGKANFFTLKEVRQLTGLTSLELKAHVKKGSLRIQKVGREWVLTEDRVLDFFDEIGIEPKWEKLRGPPQISHLGLFSWRAGKKGGKIGGALGWSVLIHGVLLTLLGLVIGLGGRAEVSRFVAFNLETTTALKDKGDAKNFQLTKSREKVHKVARQKKSQPRQQKKTEVATPPETVIPEKELLPTEVQEIQPNTFVADQILKKKKEVEPFPISEKKPAEGDIETEPATEKVNEDNMPKKDSITDTSAGLIAASPDPYRPDMGVTAPRLIHKVRPQYPERALQAGVEGSVELEIVVKADGSVGNIKVLDLPGEGLGFEEAAVEAVHKWKFLPGRFQGQPVDVLAMVAVNFRTEK